MPKCKRGMPRTASSPRDHCRRLSQARSYRSVVRTDARTSAKDGMANQDGANAGTVEFIGTITMMGHRSLERIEGEHMDQDHIMQYFAFEHLPEQLQTVSKPFCDLARAIVGDERGMPEGTSVNFPLPRNPERSVALRKLLEAKDAAVRARLSQ